MNIKEFISKTFIVEHGMIFRPRIICNDGFSMSVQASSGHYCTPRKTQEIYTSCEIGFPSEEESLINDYAETKFNWTDTIYPCVPIDTIQKIIEKHGGINVDETFKNKLDKYFK